MTNEELLNLIAQVIAWMEGEPVDTIDDAAKHTSYQDSAQQCAEDLGLLGGQAC